MKLLLLTPGKFPANIDEIKCFSDTWAYFLTKALKKAVLNTDEIIQDNANTFMTSSEKFKEDVVLVLGLRYFSHVDPLIVEELSKKHLLCQMHDGSRLDADKVITFTLRDDRWKYLNDPSRLIRHDQYNKYVGWASDPELNYPEQSTETLTLLVDHTNYGPNKTDHTQIVLTQIRMFIDSNVWIDKFKSVKVLRFDSGQVIEHDFNKSVERYDRTKHIPYSEIVNYHRQAHVFFVTHPESVGQTVLECAQSGAFIVTPRHCIAQDRLETVNHFAGNVFDWSVIMDNINPEKNRAKAIEHTWDLVAQNIIRECKSLISNKLSG